MSFALPQERSRLSYSQASLLPSFQLQQTAVRQAQPPTASPFSFQPTNISHSHPHPHPHPEGFLQVSERNHPSSAQHGDALSRTRSQENAYMLQLQEATHALPPPQPTQPQDVSIPISNGVHTETMDPDPATDSPPRDTAADMAQMTRPPEGKYPTLESLIAAANKHAFPRGYAFVIGRSKKKNKLGLKKVLLTCDRGGTSHHKMLPPDSDKRKRKTTSRKTGCEFGIYAVESQTEWTLKYRPDPACAVHNHPPSKSVTEHPAARKLNANAIAAVKAMKDAGVSAQDTLKEIQRENPGTLLIPRDVYNARAALRRDPSRGADIDPAIVTSSNPQIYRRAAMAPEERLRDDLRMELTKAREELEKSKEEHQKELEALRNQLKEKEKLIEKFEMFIDICNQRVMVQRERLTDEGPARSGGAGGS